MENVEVYSIASSDSNSTIIDESWTTQFPSSTSENSINKKTNKNIYDLSEFENDNACEALYENSKQFFESFKSEDILEELSKKYSTNQSQSNDKSNDILEELSKKDSTNQSQSNDKSEDILEEQSKKYLTNQSQSNDKSEDILDELSKKYLTKQSNNEIVEEIVLSDSSSETECNINHSKKDVSMELDKNNTIFENCFSENTNSFLHRNQIVDYNKLSLSPVASCSNEDIYNKNNFPLKRTFESISSDEDCGKKTEKKGKRIANNDKKLAAEEKKAMKAIERMNKKEQIEKEKALKQAQRLVDKSRKDSLKFMVVYMDDTIFNNKEYGDYLKEHLTSKDIPYMMKTSFPGMISWARKVLAIENTEVKKSEYPEKHYAVIIKPAAFGNLYSCIESIKEHTDFKHLSIFVYGQSKPTSSQEDEIIDIEMCFPTYWQFVENKIQLGNFIFMLTKSISQIPYKLEQEAKYNHLSEYMESYNKKNVKVDKDGNGLGQLWRQMLTMFPLVRLETAEAITAVFPTPRSMFEAYENCTELGEQLIQNLQIRRTHGPLATSRRIGPELSKKCYRLFTSKQNRLL
ncbi:unnamed protein product [Psylliodes chrysocephalus]|uniref:Crossover junction endonuclease EME1 n=1 Tax=Psylliodes chrysocephalus TaxID=3402493 RepID=A0A9P0D1N1_9CUCU|nr:unnamed protein product [Psylliodes chrysocephala]